MLNLEHRWALAASLLCATGVLSQVAVQDHADYITFRNGSLSVVLSKMHKGAIVSLTDCATGHELAATQTEPCLFRLVFTRRGDVSADTVAFSSTDAGQVRCSTKRAAHGQAAELRFSSIAGRRIEARCSATVVEDDPLVHWRISVTTPAPLVLEEIQFPIIVLRETLGDARGDDAAIAGATEDGLYLAPGDWGVGRRRVYTQPGSLAAQFGCYYDPAVGFYTATQDSKGYPKRLTIERVREGLEFAWSHLCYHDRQAPFEVGYDVVCTSFRGQDAATDWRDAADIYKQWARKQPWCARTVAERRDIPDWIKRGCVRMQWELRQDGKPDAVMAWLDRHWEQHFSPLPPFVTLIGFEHVESWVAPKYFPCYPSDEAFLAAVRKTKDMGGHVCLFPSSYQWTLTYKKRPDGSFQWDDRADFGRKGRPHAILNRDGSLLTRAHSWLRGGESAALCRGDAWARRFVSDTLMQLVDRGVEVLQIDQVVGGQWPAGAKSPCFSRDHGHPPGHGLWDADAFRGHMRSLRRTCPQVVFSAESPQELFAQDFGLFDYRHDRASVNTKIWDVAPKRHAPVFPYLYHEFVPVFHIPTHTEPVAIILAHAIVSGEIPSFKARQAEFPGEPVVANGGFERWSRGPVGWTIWHSTETGVATANPDGDTPGAGKLALRLDGERESESIQAYTYVPVDAAPVRVGGTYRLRLRMRSAGLAGTGGITVEALDCPDWRIWKRLGVWRAEVAKAANWTEHEITFAVPTGTQTLRLVLHLRGRGKVWFDDVKLEEIRSDGTAAALVRPGNAVFRLLRQWTQLAAAGAGKYLMLGTMLHPPQLRTGTTRYVVSSGKASSVRVQIYALRKDHRSSVGHTSCPLRITRGVGEWQHKSLDLTIRPGAAELHVPMSLRQKGELLFDDFVLTEVGSTKNLMRNGGFEDWPDPSAPPPGWNHIRQYQDRTYTGKFHREGTDTHSGAFAIRLVSATGSDKVHLKQVLPIDGRALSVGKTYRVTFWAKVRNVARFLPVRAEREFPAILHNAFRAPDGSEAVIAVNITDQPQTGMLRWRGSQTELSLSPWEVSTWRLPRTSAGYGTFLLLPRELKGSVWIDALQLEQGMDATAFEP